MKRKLPSPCFYGQTVIGVLIAMAIFSILAHSVFTLITSSFELVSFNRARITARHLAQEKIEFIRNLPYDEVGTSGGVPAGTLAQEENVERNKLSFTIKTAIVYVDNPFDGTQGGSPNDLLATDFKRVRVEVSWSGLAASRNNPVIFLTDIAPKGVETNDGGGTLSILVFDANGEPVPQAQVQVVQTSVTPNIDLTFETADNGRYILPGVPACVSCYEITVTKAGYSSERTYSTTEIPNPNKPHQTILEGQLSEVSFAIDRVSTITLSTVHDREAGFSTYPNISLEIHGEKTIGTDDAAQPVYKFQETLTTDTSGALNLSSVEWDNYHITIPTSLNLTVSGSNPLLPLTLLPNTSITLSLALTTKTDNSLLISFVDNTNNLQVASVSATLQVPPSVSLQKFSGLAGDPDFGQVFYDNLNNQQYPLAATISGYLDFSGSITASSAAHEKIFLTPNP